MACTINTLPRWDHASTIKCKRKQWKALKWFTLWPFINQEEKNSRKEKFVRFICSFWLNNRDYVCLSCEDIYGTGKSLPEQKRNHSSEPSFIHSQIQNNYVFFFFRKCFFHLKWWPLCKRSHWSEQTLTCKVSNMFGAERLILYLNSNLVCHTLLLLDPMPCKTHKSSESKIATNARRDLSILVSTKCKQLHIKSWSYKVPLSVFKNNQDPTTQGYLLLVDFGSCTNNKCTEQDREKWAGLAQSTKDLVSDSKSASRLPAQERLHNEHCEAPITMSLVVYSSGQVRLFSRAGDLSGKL